MTIFHVAKFYPDGRLKYLFLKKKGDLFEWEESNCVQKSVAEAIDAASLLWKGDYFKLVHCGFRYSLPIRDQVGVNALFWQMAKSYAVSSGVYFDEDVGHQCIVKFASDEALRIWKEIS